MKYLAHIAREETGDVREQTVTAHLLDTAKLARQFASKVKLGSLGELMGLLHDLGKYSVVYLNYLCSAAGILQPGDEGYIDPKATKGKIDHSTAGAQWIWEMLINGDRKQREIGQILALCICSHHGGLIDCLDDKGSPVFLNRMNKKKELIYFREALSALQENDTYIMERVKILLETSEVAIEYKDVRTKIGNSQYAKNELQKRMYIGLLIRFLYSSLIDGDRTDTANFMLQESKELRQSGTYISWEVLIERLENRLSQFNTDTEIQKIRSDISRQCLQAAKRERGVFTLTVPTGGGKTLASLRFALHHAREHNLSRIIYVIPYLSILDQNAKVARETLETTSQEQGNIILEYHSNIVREDNEDEFAQMRRAVLSENLDTPIVFTTSVHILEVLFGRKTSDTRHFHQLANSIIIFDEIQTLPIKCVHLFCNAINFLTEMCGSTVVLCTATQPLLNRVNDEKGKLAVRPAGEIVTDIKALFDQLKRVDVKDGRKTQGWSVREAAHLSYQKAGELGSCLVIANTKAIVRKIYEELSALLEQQGSKDHVLIYHLSTNMCPKHRKKVLDQLKTNLDEWHTGKSERRVICISTQLIEAGVDIDFATVIRSEAGLDSIAQAAGRCNRNGLLARGEVWIINLKDERTDRLIDIQAGKAVTRRVLDEIRGSDMDILAPEVMDRYFQYYYYERRGEMSYPVKRDGITSASGDTLLNLLSCNEKAVQEYRTVLQGEPFPIAFIQAFETAASKFEPIDSRTQGIIVPYCEQEECMDGERIIEALCAVDDIKTARGLVKKAQQYAINVYQDTFQRLLKEEAIFEVQKEMGIYALRENHYSEAFGMSEEMTGEMRNLAY